MRKRQESLTRRGGNVILEAEEQKSTLEIAVLLALNMEHVAMSPRT